MGALLLIVFAFVTLTIAFLLPLQSKQTSQSLAHALSFATAEPIMGIEGTDPERLRRSIDNLENVIAREAQTYKKDQRKSAHLLPHMIPFSFLRSLANTEELRKAFVANPSWGAFVRYEHSQRRTVAAYTRDLSVSTRIARHAFPDETKQYSFFGSSIHASDILRKLEELRVGIEATEMNLIARARCIRVNMGCEERAPRVLDQGISIKHEPTPVSVRGAKALIEENVLPESPRTEKDFPLVALQSSDACLYFYSSPVYFLPVMRIGDSGDEAFNIHPLNDLFFWDAARAAREAGVPYFKSMHELGIDYSYQPSANFYICPDNTSTQARVLTLLKVREYIAEELPKLKTMISRISPSQVTAFEGTAHAILEGEVLYEVDVQSLIALLSSLEARADEASKKIITKIRLLELTKSAGIDAIFESVTLQSESYLRGHEAGYFRTFPPDYVFLARAPFPLFFLIFNPLIAEQQEPLVLPKDRGGWMPFLLSYTNDLKNRLPPSDIKTFIQRTARYELGLPLQ